MGQREEIKKAIEDAVDDASDPDTSDPDAADADDSDADNVDIKSPSKKKRRKEIIKTFGPIYLNPNEKHQFNVNDENDDSFFLKAEIIQRKMCIYEKECILPKKLILSLAKGSCEFKCKYLFLQRA